jgi:alpha-mannosidase
VQPSFQERYVLTYDLVAGERGLRVTVTGKAPEKTAVMATFPFSVSPSGMLHGTPYHWDHKDAATFDSRSSGFHPVFEAAHDFVVPVDGSTPLAAVYPRSIRAWTVSGNQLYGCILRNSMTVTWVNSWEQSDAGSHSIEYMLRVPGNLPTPESGNLLRDARNYITPLDGRSVAGSGSLPTTSSLAAVTSPPGAMLTVAKAGTFDPASVILRLYQASNQAQQVTLDLSDWVAARPGGWVVIPFTALEAPIPDAPQYEVVNGKVTVPMPNAVLTLKLTQLR